MTTHVVDHSSLDLKESGNKLYKTSDYKGAVFLYSTAIERVSPADIALRVILLSNRAAAYIKLELFRDALSDSEAACTLDPHHAKSKFRKASCYAGLKQFGRAHKIFEELADNGCEESKAQLEITSIHINAAILPSMRAAQQATREVEYMGPIEIRESSGRGRGLYLTHDVIANDIILVEKAFASAFSDDCTPLDAEGDPVASTGAAVGLKAFQRVLVNPIDNQRLATLYDGKQPNSIIPTMSLFASQGEERQPGSPRRLNDSDHNVVMGPVLELKTILSTVVTNAFATDRLRPNGSSEPGTGLWIIAAFINHCSGSSNCTYDTRGDMMVVRAVFDMPAETELTITYVLAGRQASLKNWKIDPSTA